MLMYGWMKWVEIAPGRYDWAVRIMTGGRIDQIKDEIAKVIRPGDLVLDIGCGTGTLAVRCMKKGAVVTGLDSSRYMLDRAMQHARDVGLESKLTVVHDSVTQLAKNFPEHSFDVIVSTMALGEFPREYLNFILSDCRRLLKPGGRLIIADETLPDRPLPKILYGIGMGLLWIPQFLLLRRALFPIKDLPGTIAQGGFAVTRTRTWAASSFKLIFAEIAEA